MICLKCGYCCKYLSVIIVDDPKKGIVEDNLIHHRGDGTPCKHLRGSKLGEYSCAIHSEPWYKDTPCFAHTQVEQKNSKCRMGDYLFSSIIKK